MPIERSIPVLLVLSILGCGEANSTVDENAECRADPGLEDEYKVVKCVVQDSCVGQQPHPTCPTSPNEAVSLCALHGGGYQVSRATCGQGTTVWWSGGTVAFMCLYDEQGKLSGTSGVTDSPSYCRGYGSWTWGAQIPSECVRRSDPNLCKP